MEIQLVILLAVSCLLLGLVAGLLLSLAFRAAGRRRMLAQVKNKGLVEVVRFWTDKEGKLVIPEVEGKFIKSMDELNRNQTMRLSRLMEQLRMGSTPPPSIAHKQQPTSTSEVVDQVKFQPTQSAQMDELMPPPPPIQPVRVDLMNSLAKTLQPELPTQFSSKSIVAQVDQILQESLLGTELVKKGIRLVESKDQGMLIIVGLEQYNELEEVPNPAVREVIRSAVEEWERRSTSVNA